MTWEYWVEEFVIGSFQVWGVQVPSLYGSGLPEGTQWWLACSQVAFLKLAGREPNSTTQVPRREEPLFPPTASVFFFLFGSLRQGLSLGNPGWSGTCGKPPALGSGALFLFLFCKTCDGWNLEFHARAVPPASLSDQGDLLHVLAQTAPFLAFFFLCYTNYPNWHTSQVAGIQCGNQGSELYSWVNTVIRGTTKVTLKCPSLLQCSKEASFISKLYILHMQRVHLHRAEETDTQPHNNHKEHPGKKVVLILYFRNWELRKEVKTNATCRKLTKEARQENFEGQKIRHKSFELKAYTVTDLCDIRSQKAPNASITIKLYWFWLGQFNIKPKDLSSWVNTGSHYVHPMLLFLLLIYYYVIN